MTTFAEYELIEQFRFELARRFGVLFDESKVDQVAEILDRAAARFSRTPSSLIAALRAGDLSVAERRMLASELSVGETHFFRHSNQFAAFSEVVLPELARIASSRRKLTVLSAGCASGEEAYSLAIAIRAGVPNAADWRLEIHGVDMNVRLLERAKAAQYTTWSLRGVAPELIDAYFRPTGKVFALDDDIRSMVQFSERNLLEEGDDFWTRHRFDVVFFRNVMMYFAPEACRRIIGRLTDSLRSGGYLFLGPAETLRGISQDYELRHSHEAFFYQRRATVADPARRQPETPYSEPVVLDADESWVSAIHAASERVASLSRQSLTPRSERLSDDALATSTAAGGSVSQRIETARDYFRQERFEEATNLLSSLPAADAQSDIDMQVLRAAILTNQGMIEEATAVCHQVLTTDDLNAEAHYLLALCHEHRGEYEQAMDHDRSAIYLDSTFAMPYLHLGLLYKRLGNMEEARREFSLAAELLAREEPARLLLFGGGFTREMLVGLCQTELRSRREHL